MRCPACKTVFSAAEGTAPEPDEEEEEKPRKRKPAPRDEDEEDEKPRKKKSAAKNKDEEDEEEDNDEERTKNRDFDPGDPEEEKKRRKNRRRDDSTLSPEEREALLRAFERASWGCKLVWISFLLFSLSMMVIIVFYFQAAFPSIDTTPTPIVAAGAIGLIGWILGAVGVGLCLSGPPSPGHWGYGIAAAVAVGGHLVLLSVLASKGEELAPGRGLNPHGPVAHWGLVPTRLDAVTYYLTLLVYKDQELIPKGELNFSIIVGIAEILRTTLLLMLVSCLARAAGDDELSHKCTRAAGFASFGPGFMALGMLAFAVLITESRAGVTNFTKILFTTVVTGTYAIINGCIFPAFMACREADDACAEPFQSQIPKL